MREINDGKLEETVREINNLGNDSFRRRAKKALKILEAVGYWGMLFPEYQRAFVEKTSPILNWREKDLTIRNAVYFGLGLSVLRYAAGEGAGLIPNLDFIENTQDYFISQVASIFGTTAKNILQGYSIFDITQSLGRIAYSQITGKAIASLCLRGALFNAGHFVATSLKGKKKSPAKSL